MRASLLLLAPLAALAACTAQPREPTPTLPAGTAPADPVRDPTVQVGQAIASFFRRPPADQPAQAARAIAELEWLASTLPTNPQWAAVPSSGILELGQARNEARSALGIPRNAASQAVINGLSGAATGIEAGDRAAVARALPRSVFPLGPEEIVRRLAQPPNVPSAMPALVSLSTVRSVSSGR
jgi:hypothetical protein